MHLPVTSSIVSAQAVAVYLQQQYHLPQGATAAIIKAGVNHTYKVNAGNENFVFRLYSLDWRTKNEIAEEIRLLNLLQENGIPVSVAVKDGKGNYLQEIETPEGLRYGVLFTFAQGDKLLNFSEEVHYTIGTLMAQMHKVAQNLPLQRVTYTPQVLLEDSLAKLEVFLPPSEELDFMQATQKVLLQELHNADVTQIRQGAVHLDIWFDNIAITNEGVVTLFDFDFCGNGWQCLDMAYYILQVHSTEKEEAVCKSKMDSFFKGYESVIPVSAEEKRLIPLLGVCIYYFYLGVQCSRFDNWSNVFLNELYLKRFIKVLIKPYYEKYNNTTEIKP